MANPSSQMLRVANLFRCPKASPFRLQYRQFQSIPSLVRPSPPRCQFKLPVLTLLRPSLSNPPRISPLLPPRPYSTPAPTRTYTPAPAPTTSPFYGSRPLTRLLPALLIATCTSIFAYAQYAAMQQKQHGNRAPSTFLSENFVLNLDNLRAGRYWTLLTHTITHVSPIHLLVNMMALWSFGEGTIMIFGPATFVALWVAAGVIGGAVPMAWQVWQERQRSLLLAKNSESASASSSLWDQFRRPSSSASPSPTPREIHYHGAVGASAAILGLVGAQACFAPKFGMLVFPVPFTVPAYVAVSGFAVFSAAAMRYGWVPEWGHLAHLSGMGVGGLAYLVKLKKKFGGLRWR